MVVPRTYSELTSRRVLTSEWLEGEKLSQSQADDVGRLVNLGVICYLKQLLGTGFFHAGAGVRGCGGGFLAFFPTLSSPRWFGGGLLCGGFFSPSMLVRLWIRVADYLRQLLATGFFQPGGCCLVSLAQIGTFPMLVCPSPPPNLLRFLPRAPGAACCHTRPLQATLVPPSMWAGADLLPWT